MHPTISKEDYEVRLVQHLLSNRFLRTFNGKFVTSRAISEGTFGFETEDSLCHEWILSIYESYNFYEGFDTFDKCKEFIHSTNYNDDLYRIIQFNDQFYAMIYQNAQHQQIIGKDLSYFTKNNMFICAKRPPSNLMIKERLKLPPIPLIYYELAAFDPKLTVYELSPDTKQYVELPILDAVEYAVLLGVTFKDIWYTCDTPHAIAHNRALLDLYFSKGHNLTLFGKYSKAIAINPFQRLISLQRGRVEHFQWDVEDRRSQQRLLPYREVRRYHENIRTRQMIFETEAQPLQL